MPQPLRTSLALSPDLSSVPPAPGREAASHMSPWQRQPCRTLITKTAQVDGGKEDRKREILRLENTLPLALPAFGTRRTSGSLQLGFWTGCAPHTHTHTHTHPNAIFTYGHNRKVVRLPCFGFPFVPLFDLLYLRQVNKKSTQDWLTRQCK